MGPRFKWKKGLLMANVMNPGSADVSVLNTEKLMSTTNVMNRKLFHIICRKERAVRIQIYTLSKARWPRFKSCSSII